MLENKTTLSEVQQKKAEMLQEGKKVITFSLKQKYFDAILAGRKVQEFREIRPSTIKRLVQLDKDGYDIEDENGNALPIEYDAIHFITGARNAKHRDCALVEVESAFIEYIADKEGNIIEWQADDGAYWQVSQVVYNLGRILAKTIYPKDKVTY